MKDIKHYTNALGLVLKQLEDESLSEEMRQALSNKKFDLESKVEDINNNLADIDYRQKNQKEGYVYVISNLGAFEENIYIIGMTKRLDPKDRIDELSGASVPFNFDVHAMLSTEDAPDLENARIHS